MLKKYSMAAPTPIDRIYEIIGYGQQKEERN